MKVEGKRFRIADLFCGAGGTSTGALQAAEAAGLKPDLTAVNHWPRAIETHTANHPEARHFCETIDSLDPRSLYKLGELDLLWASPECMHHSVARGGRPVNDQSRATAWCVTRWAEALQPGVILVENVPEFENWGPIGTNGKPLKSKRGEIFRAWVSTLESIGYKVDWRVLCAADHGDPTTRRRLFVQAVRGRRKIRWPEPTHFPIKDNLFGESRYRSAREIINWDHPTRSIFDPERKKLSENTLRRIEIGLEKFGLEPFFVPQQSRHETRSTDRPYPTITGSSRGEGLCVPFLVQANFGSDCGEHRVGSIEEPLKTVLGSNIHGLAQPFLIRVGHYGKDGNGSPQVASVDEPLKTVTTKQEHSLVEPYLIHLRGTSTAHSIDSPAPAVTSGGGHLGLCKPFLTKFYGSESEPHSIDKPLGTVTTKDRFGLVLPQLEINGETYALDIHFRMLQPDELAAAQGFPSDYEFTGTKTEITKQIGNAVPCGLARALVGAVLEKD